MTYAALWCKSNCSFLEGASHPDELVEEAHEHGIRSIAITDRDGVYGMVRAHVKARELGVHLIVGSQISVDDDTSIILLAQDRAGYANLCQLITTGRRRRPKGESIVTWREVCQRAGGLIAVWGGAGSALAGDQMPACANDVRDAFGDRLFAAIARHRRAEDVPLERRLRERAGQLGIPTVAAPEVLYHHRARRPLQDVVTCIRHGVKLVGAGKLIRANAEYDLKSPFTLTALYSDDPGSVARTLDVARRCRFSLGDLRYRYPSEWLPDGTSSSQWLRKLTLEGARGRYGGTIPDDVAVQIDRELALIEELDYGGYFLTMHDIVTTCRQREILCQGRGSAANSAVCYCLGITAVDPVRMGFLFERFLSRERAEPPDIDLDIAHERREEVIQHVYEKYGRERAAMVANFVRYRPRSAVRDVGKVLGIAETALDRASKLIHRYGGVDPETMEQAGLSLRVRDHQLLVELSNQLLDFPRHLSIHPGGFLLGHEPVCDIVPIENATMEARTVIQWDKDDLEDLGLFKVDLLGLGALTQLDLCFRMLETHRGTQLSMATIPIDDKATYDMICAADTVGVFQIESRAQMSMLPRLLPRHFYDLVIEVSIVRPGPIAGGMVHPYLRRRNGEEPVVYPHECLRPVLEKTLGVPLFQEQVMKLAIVAADYTPGEADQLRRDMAAWRRSGRIEKHRELLTTRMTAKGITPEFAERVFEQIKGFGEYGFPECVVGDTRVIDADTGRWVTIADVASGRENLRRTLTCSDNLRIEPRRVIAIKDSGEKPVFRLRTALGRQIEATAEHPFLTITGWRKLGALEVGDSIAAAREQSEVEWDRIVSIEPVGSHQTFDLEIEGNHNFLANDFVVHNSHAASFALISYATSWLRCHYPAEFCCSLLNAQPMGFYTPATIVEDARRHGVKVLPIDVRVSDDDCSLEPLGDEVFAVRMGLRYLKGVGQEERNRIVMARRQGPFSSLADFVRQTQLSRRTQDTLAESGALAGFGIDRRLGIWQVRGLGSEQSDEIAIGSVESTLAFPELSQLETVLWDYRTSSHSVRGHPLGPLRSALRAHGLPDARSVSAMRDGQQIRYAGVVICRQRPGTASGVTFMTLEDETGFVNAVIWRQVFDQFSLLAKSASFLGITGRLQVQPGIVHLIADELWAPVIGSTPAAPRSRDFH